MLLHKVGDLCSFSRGDLGSVLSILLNDECISQITQLN